MQLIYPTKNQLNSLVTTLLIAELLQAHDCVILPELGAFLAHSSSASIHIIDKKIIPPHKTISFNGSLFKNDGLLIDLVARKFNYTYEQAQILVEQQCRIWQTKMLLGEIICFENIGNLWMGLDKKIQFKSTANFLNSSNYYGLMSLPIAAIVREETKNEIISNFVKETDKGLHPQGYLNDFIHEEKKERKPFKKIIRIAAAAIFVGIIGLASWWMSSKNDAYNFASFISIDSFFHKDVEIPVAIKPTNSATTIVNPIQHPYTFYLNNPAEPYYLITDTNLNLEAANKKKFDLMKDGIDARIIQIDSIYQVGIYEFATQNSIKQIKSTTDSLLHTETVLMKLMN